MSYFKLQLQLILILILFIFSMPVFAERAHLKISSAQGGWQHMKLGNNSASVWGPALDVSQHTSVRLVIKDLGGADWGKLQIAPNGSSGVPIGNHFNGNASDWVTVTIPLSVFLSSSLSNLSHLSLPFSDGANAYAFGLDSVVFTGGAADLVWFDAETKNNNATAGSIVAELIPDDGNGGGGGGELPDLTISDLQSVGTGEQGEVVSYRFDLNNIGDVLAVDDYTIGAFLSTDSTFSINDTQVGVVNTGNTPLGTIQNVDAAITVPDDLAAGNYRLILVADIDSQIVEKNEANNASSISFTVTGDGGGGGGFPDLRAIGILDLPPGVDPGETFSTRFQFENIGGLAESDFVVSLSLSNDSFVSSDDRLLRTSLIRGLSAGGTQTAIQFVVMPTDVAPGDYRLLLNVDGGNNIVESNENNNVASRGLRVFGSGGGDLPDLTVSDLQSIAVGEPGEIVIYTFDLNNVGDVVVDNDYRIAAFLSTDPFFSNDDVEAGEVSTGNTPLGTIDNVGAAITVPVDLEPGDYHLIIFADVDSEILEANESNNTVSIPFAVTTDGGGGGGGGDDVTHLSINNTIGGWQKIKIGHNPNNLWGPPISPVNGNNQLEFVVKDFSGNTEWDKIALIINDRNGSDIRLGNFLPSDTSGWFTISIPLSVFPANIFEDITRLELFSRDAAPWEIGVASITFSGGSNEFVWLGEENNQHQNAVDSNFITSIEVDGSGGGGGEKPDLTVSNMSQPAAGAAGDVVNFTFDLNNIGDILADNSYFIGAFISVDNIVDDGDSLAGVVPTGNTSVGTISAVPAAITVPDLAPGTYRLILKADAENSVDESNENNNVISRSFTLNSSGGGAVEIDTNRSLTETAVEVLNVFKLEDLLNQLASQSGEAGLTGIQFWRQFWDTQNPGPGLGLGPHCDDESILNPTFNGYQLECPRPEGDEVNNDPFSDGPTGYEPVALSNRFDLAGTDGSSCGQYRITFARNSGKTDILGRNFVIFEAELPNPAPSCGLEGCRPIVDFWAGLSEEGDESVRATMLQDFYFNGIPSENVSPVFHVNNYMAGTGQVRTNQFLNQPFFTLWQLREYKLGVFCAGNDCDMDAVPVTVKENPFGELFDLSFTDARAGAFRNFFPSQVESLSSDDLNGVAMLIPDQFQPGESSAQSSLNNYETQLDLNGSFADSIQNRLNQLGSTLTPLHIARRATTQSCGGCHQFSNGRDLGNGMTWPFSLNFVHTSESTFVDTDGVERHQRSQALNDVFLPHRKAIFEDFVENVGSCAAQGRSVERQGLSASIAGKQSASSVTADEISVNAIQVESAGNGSPLALSPAELSALDRSRKEGRSKMSVGGPARSH